VKVKAKEILKNKFWIVEGDGINIGTLSMNDDRFLFSSSTGTRFFDNEKQLKRNFGSDLTWQNLEITEIRETQKEVHSFPTSCVPFNSMYDVKRKLPLFTKSDKSKSLYCAGYYVIKFDKGWVKSFCPKLITVERYETRGPFKTELEMRQELSNVNSI